MDVCGFWDSWDKTIETTGKTKLGDFMKGLGYPYERDWIVFCWEFEDRLDRYLRSMGDDK